jgi:hypothetical protein
MASTKALLKSILPSKRDTKPATSRSKATPAEKSEMKAIRAEATYYALR